MEQARGVIVEKPVEKPVEKIVESPWSEIAEDLHLPRICRALAEDLHIKFLVIAHAYYIPSTCTFNS